MKSHVESDSNTLQFSYQDVFYEYLPYGVVLLFVFAAAGFIFYALIVILLRRLKNR